MGFFKKMFGNAVDDIKKGFEEGRKKAIEDSKSGTLNSIMNDIKKDALGSSSKTVDDDADDEPRINIGKLEDGVLTISESFSELDDESLEEYKRLRKIVFPASLKKLDSYVISDQEELEVVDLSKVSQLKEIPDDFISGETCIKEFVIPQGVSEVGAGFLGECGEGTKVFVPASVKKLGYINGNDNNDQYVYLFAPNLDISDVEQDIKTLYVLPEFYGYYAKQLKDCDSEARLRKMPEEAMKIYQTAKHEIKPTPPTEMQPEAETKIQPKPDPEKENTPVSGDNEMFSSRLETLINSALKDGVLTDKEREIIKKRAEAEGEDWGEVEMLLDARLEEMQSDPSFLAAQFISIEERLSAKRAEWHSTEIGSDIWKQLAGEQTALKAELDRCKLKLAKIGILVGNRIDYDALSRLINPTSQPQTTINTPAEVSQPQQSEDYADKKMPPRIFGKDSNLKGQNSIVIPEGVEEIADEAFYNCNRLQKIVFSAALKKIGKSILGDCNRLKNINLSRCTELKTIGEEAFKFIPKQKEISLPDCVTTIEREAFYGVDIRHFIMPASLENLENNIFSMFERNIKIDFSKVTKLKVIPSYFCGANELTIPQGVTTIEECAFDPERWDSKLFLPPSLKKIEGEGDEDYGNFDEVFVFSPMIEGLFENVGGTIYVLPEHIEAYKTYCNTMEYERSIEPMPDEYLYYYDN